MGTTLFVIGVPWISGVPATARIGTVSASVGVVQSFGAANATGGATLSASPSATTGAGDLLVALTTDRNTTALAPVSSVTDSAGNSWVRAVSVAHGTHAEGEIWYAANSASLTSSQAVMVTVGGTSASTSAVAFTVLDVSGASASPLDTTATKSGSRQPASTGTTAATAQASEIAVGDIGWNASVTPSGQTAGYTTSAVEQSTVSGSAAGEQAAWDLLTAVGPTSYSATLSSPAVAWTGAIATFRTGTSTPPPTIASLTPTSGPDAASVTITGTGFTGATTVMFNTTQQPTFAVNGDSQITTTVPIGATTGRIAVTAPGGTATSSTPFTVNPSITSFSPSSGAVGTPVTISGSGFTGITNVAFGGTPAVVSSSSDAQITTSVPAAASTGAITVTTPGGSAASSIFTVSPSPAPMIADFNPTSGVVGAAVVITGTGFTGATAVTFNNTSQPAYTLTGDTQITTTVPAGASTGVITVTTPGGIATTSSLPTQNFTVNPSPTPMIAGLTPTSGPVAAPVTITGTGFTAASAVAFNGTGQPVYTVTSDTEITTTVPNGAATGTITVTTPGGTATSPIAFTVTAPSRPHVMVIMLENQGYAATLGTCSADPYLCSLAGQYASATAWYGAAHPSLPNYLAVTTGSTQGCTSDTCFGPYTVPSLGGQLTAAGVPWTAYMESMPSACYAGKWAPPGASGSTAAYAEKHNPFVLVNDVLSNGCAQDVLPYPGSSSLVATLGGSSAPDFVWITPNQQDSMHSGTVTAGDNWLSTNLAPVLASSWFTGGNATVVITMDEHRGSNVGCCGDAAGGQIPTVVVSNNASGKGNVAVTGSLYGLLRTIEEAYGLGYLGGASDPANGDLLSLFG